MKNQAIGQIIGGEFNKIIVRAKKGSNIQIGEILVSEDENYKFFFQVYNLVYGSQISQQNLELISGLELEEENEYSLYDAHLRKYILVICKNLLVFDKKRNTSEIAKSMPELLAKVRRINNNDLNILTKPENALFIGNLRSGSKKLDINVFIDGKKMFQHHVLVAATTGRGKSNLTSVIIWNALYSDYASFLILDAHDEYFGRNKIGLKDHKNKDKVVYYTSNSFPGCISLYVNINDLSPYDLYSIADWSSPQKEAMTWFYNKSKNWIKELLTYNVTNNSVIRPETLSVIKRRFFSLLDIEEKDDKLNFKGIFKDDDNINTIDDICNDLERGKTVIIDTSNLSSEQEIIIGSAIANKMFCKYKKYKKDGELNSKPNIIFVIEEAPRVLGKEVLKSGNNIFSTIAREGRKFKIGLYAITQTPSEIPRQILTNINTKIILGLETKPERQAIIESSSNDLSNDEKMIASLGVGEAIITSNFLGFAIPIKIPKFEEFAKKQENNANIIDKSIIDLV